MAPRHNHSFLPKILSTSVSKDTFLLPFSLISLKLQSLGQILAFTRYTWSPWGSIRALFSFCPLSLGGLIYLHGFTKKLLTPTSFISSLALSFPSIKPCLLAVPWSVSSLEMSGTNLSLCTQHRFTVSCVLSPPPDPRGLAHSSNN